jgi:hypothetical protein
MKTSIPILLLALASASAQLTQTNSGEAFIRGGASANTDQNEATSGYIMVKYNASPFTTARKAYFKFDFTGLNPNTNALLNLSFTTVINNQRQHIQVWTLDQPYPGFSAAMTWNNAQANDTASNSMLTNGAFTATAWTDFLSPNGGGATANVTIPPPWGAALINNQLCLALATISDPTNGDNGTRITLNSTTLAYEPVYSGAPPSIGAIPNITTVATQNSVTNSFTVGDPEDGPNALFPLAASSNEAVVPTANVVFGGSGANRTVYVVGAAPGKANITVSVYDSAGNRADRIFTVTVLPQDFAPVISTPPPTNTPLNTAITVPFTVSDAETHATNLVVTATVASYSANILASATVNSDASGTNRTVTVTPVTGSNGVGVVLLSVSDGVNTSSNAFGVMVLPAAETVFSEHFDYPDGKIFVNSGAFWTRRSASAGSVNLNTASQQANIRPASGADDGAAPLAGAPYNPSSGAMLYAVCNATWYETADGRIPTNSSGSFLQFLNNSGATSLAAAEVGVSSNTAPVGFFQLGLLDATAAFVPNPHVNLTIPPGTGPETHKLVTRYDVRAGTSTLWVDAASEAAPAVTVHDVNNPASISFIGLRQDLGMGYIYIDDLRVVLVRPPVITGITPPASGTVPLIFTGSPAQPSDFIVELATMAEGPYNPVTCPITQEPDGSFKALAPAPSNAAGFYRIKRKPLTF